MAFANPVQRRKIRFINPNSKLSTITMPELIRHMTFSRKAIFAPSGLGVCAAVMPADWEVEIVDECTQAVPHRATADVDVVGITSMTTQAKRAYEIADEYRRLGVTVFHGGIHPSAVPEDALPHADAVCKGDGETCLPRMIGDWERWQETAADQYPTFGAYLLATRAVGAASRPRPDANHAANRSSGRGLETPPTGCGAHDPRVYDWAKFETAPIATPRKDLLDPRDYLIFNPIQTTRGCPHSCSFCTTPGVFGRKFRQREIADIVEEIKEAKERHKSWAFIFADDDFGGNHKWALEMCAALEPLKISWASQCDILISRNDELLAAMKRSGCVGLILGLESRKQDTLTESGKKFVKADSYEWRIRKIQSYGISLWGAFIFGFDHDDWTDLMRTCRFAQKMNLAMSCYPILTPYPGTGVWHEYKKEGRITSEDWDKYNGASVVYTPKNFSPIHLRHAQMAAFAEFYSPRAALRRLGVWPLKKRAWVANLAIWRGIEHYYGKRNRQVPRFADFLNPRSRAWNYADTWGDPQGPGCLCDLSPSPSEGEGWGEGDEHASATGAASLAADMITESDPFVGASRALAGSAGK